MSTFLKVIKLYDVTVQMRGRPHCVSHGSGVNSVFCHWVRFLLNSCTTSFCCGRRFNNPSSLFVCVSPPQGSSVPVAAAASRVTQPQPDRLHLYMETPSWAGQPLKQTPLMSVCCVPLCALTHNCAPTFGSALLRLSRGSVLVSLRTASVNISMFL